jgi:hypothetical protein
MSDNLPSIFERDVEDETSERELPVETEQKTIVEVPAHEVVIPAARSRIGITKKIYRPAAEKKARKLAKKMRMANRRK